MQFRKTKVHQIELFVVLEEAGAPQPFMSKSYPLQQLKQLQSLCPLLQQSTYAAIEEVAFIGLVIALGRQEAFTSFCCRVLPD